MKSIRAALAASILLFAAAPASAQLFDPNRGLFAPDYITPSLRDPGYMTGGQRSAPASRGGRLVFAAATVDARCQQDGSPQVQVLAPPRGGRIAADLGWFRATGTDAGSTYCLGYQVRGTRIYYVGRPPRSGDSFSIRVVYPTRGLTYDHTIAVAGR
ncbi:MAG TPA: hypothetical protein VIG34_04530 [Xanthobacteraceae bacterium]|jgi:hypothetical protein